MRESEKTGRRSAWCLTRAGVGCRGICGAGGWREEDDEDKGKGWYIITVLRVCLRDMLYLDSYASTSMKF